MSHNKTTFANHNCYTISNAALTLYATADLGPRLIGLVLNGRDDNLLATVPHASATTPSGRTYQFHGGHRLWHAPEHPERSYIPDDRPPIVTPYARGLQLSQPLHPDTGLTNTITITLPDDSPRLIIDHTIRNHTLWPLTLAPWAITQFPPGGFAILPQNTTDTGLLPNRHLAIWPYTPLNSPYIQWDNPFIFIHAKLTDKKIKIGWPNPHGWLAYWRDRVLFVKQAAYQPNATYPDNNSNSECYADEHILELETLGPLGVVQPGTAVHHREIWRIFPNINLSPDPNLIKPWVNRLSHY
ncbi:MAG TPA: hypothetical protein VLL52_00405 [Anaerolineae bacterium]|nr:hypothetical protein [Anaerolineae bacterium]